MTIFSLKMDDGGSVPEQVNRMQELFLKLKDIGEKKLSDT